MDTPEGEGKLRDAYKFRPLIVLHDKKSRVWDSPIAYDSDDACIRQLKSAAKYGKDTRGNPPIFAQYPDDFELYCVGYWNLFDGTIVPVHNFICGVADILAQGE